ncbi:MAG: hypothetical protein NZR01_14075 [Bryobacteraceae bacterium]|nr:hypothetical protein [Bryobacteraceae bacterium]
MAQKLQPRTPPSPPAGGETLLTGGRAARQNGAVIQRAAPVRLPCGLVLGAGAAYPEFLLPYDPSSPAADARCLEAARHLLESAAGRIDGIVLTLDLTAHPAPALRPGLLEGLLELRHRFSRHAGLPAAVSIALPASEMDLRAAARAGADILTLEAPAGLALFRRALPAADLRGILASLAMLAAPQAAALSAEAVRWLQPEPAALGGCCAAPFIREIAAARARRAAPEPLCAVALAVCAVPTLASFESGAAGPTPPAAWESLFVKAIRGCPVSLAATWPCQPGLFAAADLWRACGTPADAIADCLALRRGELPRAPAPPPSGPLSRILCADAILGIAEAIQTCLQPYQRAVAAAYAAATILAESGPDAGPGLAEADRELALHIAEDLISLPESGQELLEQAGSTYGSSILSGEIAQ